MRTTIRFIVALLLLAMLAAACSPRTYPYKRRKIRKDCDCPNWTHHKAAEFIRTSHENL